MPFSKDKDNNALDLLEVTFSEQAKMIPNEHQCIGLEFSSLLPLPSTKRIFCFPSYLPKISDYLHTSLLRAFTKSVKKMAYADIQLPDRKENFFVEYQMNNGMNNSLKLSFTETGLQTENEVFLLFKDVKKCGVCWEGEECCLNVMEKEGRSRICIREDFRCERSVRRVAKLIYERCRGVNGMEIEDPPGYCKEIKSLEFQDKAVLNKIFEKSFF